MNLDVEFYGRGKFSPLAYHSEGHQDGMGLCLYLALMRLVLGNRFTICLLDDVLTTVDASHRKEVCKILKSEFTSTQFVFTTHDDVWARQMIHENFLKSANLLQFRAWTVGDGPRILEAQDVWKEIVEHLINEKISEASHALRRYLEFQFYDLTLKLRARLEARHHPNHDGKINRRRTPTA